MSRARTATALPAPVWHGDLAVVSPHLDDAVLSVGASMRAAVRHGATVTIVTVHAGDPAAVAPADRSHRVMGFTTAGGAARLRREEDERACRALGVRPVWLDFPSEVHEPPAPDDEIVEALRTHLGGCDAVLAPGFPLVHPDHVSVGRHVVASLAPRQPLGLYVEQPYAAWQALSRSRDPRLRPDAGLRRLELTVSPAPRWLPGPAGPADWLAKLRAGGAYRSQLAVLRRAPRMRILLHEAIRGGERVLWCRLDDPVRS